MLPAFSLHSINMQARPCVQIRLKKTDHRVDMRKLSLEQCVQPIFGFYVTSSKRRGWVWPMYLSDLKAAGLQRVIESWSEVHSAVSTWEQPQWQILHYQRELPQKLIDEIKNRTYGETLPTAKQFSAAYPPPDVVDAMQTQLLGPPPQKKTHTHRHTHTHTYTHTLSFLISLFLSLHQSLTGRRTTSPIMTSSLFRATLPEIPRRRDRTRNNTRLMLEMMKRCLK